MEKAIEIIPVVHSQLILSSKTTTYISKTTISGKDHSKLGSANYGPMVRFEPSMFRLAVKHSNQSATRQCNSYTSCIFVSFCSVRHGSTLVKDTKRSRMSDKISNGTIELMIFYRSSVVV